MFEKMCFAAVPAEPEMLDRMSVDELPVVQRAFLKSKKLALSIVEFRPTSRIGTLREHA